MQGQWRLLLWWCEVQSGASLGQRRFVPLSWALLPSDDGPIVRASSGPAPFRPADKAPFHKTKAGKQRGKEGERGEKGSDRIVERQRRWEGEMQGEYERVKGRKERVVMEESLPGRVSKCVRFLEAGLKSHQLEKRKEQKNN